MDQVLTVTEAAGKAKCSENTIYRAARSGQLIASKIGAGDGSDWRIFEHDLEAWLISLRPAPRQQTTRPPPTPREPARRQRGSLRALERESDSRHG